MKNYTEQNTSGQHYIRFQVSGFRKPDVSPKHVIDVSFHLVVKSTTTCPPYPQRNYASVY
jgi:hypothetical protein